MTGESFTRDDANNTSAGDSNENDCNISNSSDNDNRITNMNDQNKNKSNLDSGVNNQSNCKLINNINKNNNNTSSVCNNPRADGANIALQVNNNNSNRIINSSNNNVLTKNTNNNQGSTNNNNCHGEKDGIVLNLNGNTNGNSYFVHKEVDTDETNNVDTDGDIYDSSTTSNNYNNIDNCYVTNSGTDSSGNNSGINSINNGINGNIIDTGCGNSIKAIENGTGNGNNNGTGRIISQLQQQSDIFPFAPITNDMTIFELLNALQFQGLLQRNPNGVNNNGSLLPLQLVAMNQSSASIFLNPYKYSFIQHITNNLISQSQSDLGNYNNNMNNNINNNTSNNSKRSQSRKEHLKSDDNYNNNNNKNSGIGTLMVDHLNTFDVDYNT